ncbi:MAG: glycosyltransferase family 4 protein [Pseudomonadota bacterium]|nr:MAG: hypothetical protein DIU56_11490 [Pseudomonadota bacterium]
MTTTHDNDAPLSLFRVDASAHGHGAPRRSAHAAVSRRLRYAYVKNGDAVDQVRRVLESGYRDGPDAFIGDFIRAHAEDELLVLCCWPRKDVLKAPNIHAESFPAVRTGPRRFLSRAWSALRIGWAILAFRPDRVLCGCTGELLWVSVAAAKLLGVPVVNSRHNSLTERRGLGRIVSWLDRMCVRACDAVVCHGPFTLHEMRRIGVPETRAHEFGLSFRDFAERSLRTSPPPELSEFVRRFEHIVMFVGRVQRDKGVIDLLDAYRMLPESVRDRTGLVYVGDGRGMFELENGVRERMLTDRVLIMGRVPHDRLPAVMRLATVVTAPTRPEFPEGRCKVVPEALVLGVPVIAPNFGPFPFGVRDGIDGLLFSPGSVSALASSLERVLGDPGTLEALRRGAKASRERLMGEPVGFARAVEAAFRCGRSAR